MISDIVLLAICELYYFGSFANSIAPLLSSKINASVVVLTVLDSYFSSLYVANPKNYWKAWKGIAPCSSLVSTWLESLLIVILYLHLHPSVEKNSSNLTLLSSSLPILDLSSLIIKKMSTYVTMIESLRRKKTWVDRTLVKAFFQKTSLENVKRIRCSLFDAAWKNLH